MGIENKGDYRNVVSALTRASSGELAMTDLSTLIMPAKMQPTTLVPNSVTFCLPPRAYCR